MKKIIFLLIAVSILQSCMKIDSKIKVDEDGKASIVANVDMSKLNSMQKSLSWTSTPKNFCNEYYKGDDETEKLTWECKTIDENHSIITDTSDLKTKKWIFNYNSWVYLLDLKNLFIDENKENSSTGSEENQIKNIAIMATMWFQYNMELELPWKIIKSDIWSFSWNHLYLDLEKDYLALKKKNVYVIVKKDWINMTDDEVLKKVEDNSNKEEKSKLKEKYNKQLILIKMKLKNQNKTKYIKQIDKLLSKLSKEKQEEVFNKIQKLKKKNDIINYLEAKIYLSLN